jgi:nicotinate-nucleotide pyrophosphorylase (carboxylating)
MLKGRMQTHEPDNHTTDHIISLALTEDIGGGDVTSQSLIPEAMQAKMQLNARSPLVACGQFMAERVYAQLDPAVRVSRHVKEGELLKAGETILTIEGNARSLLTGERVTLNFMQRMSGVATLTKQYVKAVEGTGATILDTRKTLPGFRMLDKYTVRMGGGQNHRMRLDDMVLIKDNHIALHGSIAAAIAQARSKFTLPVVVECDTLEQLREAIEAKPERIMLDNMDANMLRQAVAITQGRIPLEATGGITLSNIRGVAASGVQFISIGALTHSAIAADIGADIVLESH